MCTWERVVQAGSQQVAVRRVGVALAEEERAEERRREQQEELQVGIAPDSAGCLWMRVWKRKGGGGGFRC